MDYSSQYLEAVAARWWLMALRGVLGVAFGIAMVTVPELSLGVLVFLWASFVLSDGLMAAGLSSRRGATGHRWGWLLFEGVVSIAAGAIAFAWAGGTTFALMVTIAVRTAASGLAELREASLLRHQLADEVFLGTAGVLSIGVGVSMSMIYPTASVSAVRWLLGAHGIAVGVLLFSLSVRLFRWRRASDHPGVPLPR